MIILGISPTSLGVMRVLGRRGISAYFTAPQGSYIVHSRWYQPCPSATEEYPSPPELAQFLADLPFDRAVLMPCADDWVRAVASLEPSLRRRFPASIADPATIDRLMDKGRLAAELERLGLPHPKTVVVTSMSDLKGLPEEFFVGAFLKPRDSLGFLRRFGAKAFRIRDKADALARFAEFEKAGQAVVLQEFIPGSMSDHYFIEGFVDREGVVRARFARQRLRMFPMDFGSSAYTVSMPLEEVASAWDVLNRLLADIRYRGIFSAEFMYDRRDGKFRLLEVNVRPYVHIEFAARCGVDLCHLAYRDALGLPVEPIVDYAAGRRCHDLETDLPVAWQLISRDQLNPLSWLLSYVGADGLVFTWDDPAPAIHRLRNIIRGQLRAKRRAERRGS